MKLNVLIKRSLIALTIIANSTLYIDNNINNYSYKKNYNESRVIENTLYKTENQAYEIATIANTEQIQYYDSLDKQLKTHDAIVIQENQSELTSGWYVLNNSIVIYNRLRITGDVNIILADGSLLDAKSGIEVSGENNLTIWGQSDDYENNGKIIANGSNGNAGIGSSNNLHSGIITINGGNIKSSGGNADGAGIGGGKKGNGTVIINGGYVSSTGALLGSGIGGGNAGNGVVTINSGIVNATGGAASAAGIGGGCDGSGDIVINGGIINSTGNDFAAGIGGGQNGYGNVTITGGEITAIGGYRNDYFGIGDGTNEQKNEIPQKGTFSTGDQGNAIIHGSVTDQSGKDNWKGIVDDAVYGDFTLDHDVTFNNNLTIPDGSSLTITEGANIEAYGGITNHGNITNKGQIENYNDFINDGNIVNDGNIDNYGNLQNAEDGIIENNKSLNNSGHFTNNGEFENEGKLNSHGIIENDGNFNNNDRGSVENNSFLRNSGNLKNDGHIYNEGYVYNDDEGNIENNNTLTNNGELTNNGSVSNDGLFNNNNGFIENYDTLTNSGELYNDGNIINEGEITNSDDGIIENNETLTNSGTLTNDGNIANHGSLNNTDEGTIENNETLTNSGTLTNDGNIINQGNLNNTENGIIDNNDIITNSGKLTNDGSISNNEGSYFENQNNGLVQNNKDFVNKEGSNYQDNGTTQNKQYVVKFVISDDIQIPNMNVEIGSKIKAPNYIREGYTLVGWYIDEEFTEKWDFDNDVMPSNDITLYGKFTINSYTISFTTNENVELPNDITQNYGTKVKLPKMPDKVGYTGKWIVDGKEVTEITITDNIIVEFVYDVNSYIVTFMNNSKVIEKINVKFGDKLIQPNSIDIKGYQFNGWYLDKNFSNKWDINNDIMPSNDITLYAKYTIMSYTISFTTNENVELPNDITQNYGTKVKLPKTPDKVGYTGKWIVDGKEVKEINVTDNIKVEFIYVVNSYTVTFISNRKIIAKININFEDKLTQPNLTNIKGYQFNGWYLDKNFSNKWDFDNDTMPSYNITLYAKWIKKAGVLSEDVTLEDDSLGAKIQMSDQEFAEAVITDNDRKLLEEGQNIQIILDINNAIISEQEEQILKEKTYNYNLYKYYDIEILKMIDDDKEIVSKTLKPIRITIEIPSEIKDKEYVVIRLHDGVITFLEDIDNDDKTYTFESDEFSIYTLAYKKDEVSNKENENKEEDNKKNINWLKIGIIITIILTIAIIIIIIIRKKFNDK